MTEDKNVLTFFDVLVLFLLVFAASRMPGLDMVMDQVWLAILTIAVFYDQDTVRVPFQTLILVDRAMDWRSIQGCHDRNNVAC